MFIDSRHPELRGPRQVKHGGPIFHTEGDKVRVSVLEEVKGETVTVGFWQPTSEFEEFAPEAQKVLDSIEWRGS